MSDRHAKLSRALSHMLRHRPDLYGVSLDEAGWVSIETVITALHRHGKQWAGVTADDVHAMIAAAEKQRLEAREGWIRAVYGHSLPGRIAHNPDTPPAVLFHGTTRSALQTIIAQGLLPMRRQLVHLSADTETATRVAGRRTDDPVIIRVQSGKAHSDGVVFYRSNDEVWLAESIAPAYLNVPKD